MRAVGKLGEIVWVPWDELRHAAGVIGTVLCLSVQPRYWARTVWNLFARQVLAVGVEPLGFVGVVAAVVGMSVAAPSIEVLTVPSDSARNSHAKRKAAQAKFDGGGLRPLTGGFPLATCLRRISDTEVPTRCRSAHAALQPHWHSASLK